MQGEGEDVIATEGGRTTIMGWRVWATTWWRRRMMTGKFFTLLMFVNTNEQLFV